MITQINKSLEERFEEKVLHLLANRYRDINSRNYPGSCYAALPFLVAKIAEDNYTIKWIDEKIR